MTPSCDRFKKTVGSAKTKYIYSGSHMMEEWNNVANTLTTRYVYAGADEPVLQMTSAGVVTYIHHDHHGSVIAQSNATTGNVGNKYKYGPFGESAATLPGTTIGYTGQRYDTELGLYHYKARYFHPGLGRFLQPDPIGYKAGMNLYAYCSNDGLNHTDPDGLEDEPVKGGHMEISAMDQAVTLSLKMIETQTANAAKVAKTARGIKQVQAIASSGIKAIQAAAAKYHGNDKRSEKAQHIYEIVNETKGIKHKDGLTDSKISPVNGLPQRTNTLVRRLNKNGSGDTFSGRNLDHVPAGPGARDLGTRLEGHLIVEQHQNFGGAPGNIHIPKIDD